MCFKSANSSCYLISFILIFQHVFSAFAILFFCFQLYESYSCYILARNYNLLIIGKTRPLYKTCISTCIFKFTPVVSDDDRCYSQDMFLKLKSVVIFSKSISSMLLTRLGEVCIRAKWSIRPELIPVSVA